MPARNSLWVAALLGALCLGIGASVGVAWASSRTESVWTAAPPLPAGGTLPSFAGVVRRIEAGVVNVVALREGAAPAASASGPNETAAPPTEADRTLRSVHAGSAAMRSGSGFVVSAGGLVVTSRHVVLGALHVDVLVPGRGEFAAVLVGEDPATDLALLRLVDAPANLTALALATDSALQAGDWIVAVGNPFGYAQTVTAGVVSFVGRHLRHSDFGVTSDFLQISAPVNPGSSGCPVVDLHGRVVGVTTQAPVDAQGISFAVPARAVAWTLDAMQQCRDGRVRRGFLGIEFQSRGDVDGDGRRRPGALITDVMAGQPAHQAGLRVGDIVVEVDGAGVADAMALHERIVRSPPGSRIDLHLLRGGHDGAPDRVTAVLGEVGSRDGRRAH